MTKLIYYLITSVILSNARTTSVGKNESYWCKGFGKKRMKLGKSQLSNGQKTSNKLG